MMTPEESALFDYWWEHVKAPCEVREEWCRNPYSFIAQERMTLFATCGPKENDPHCHLDNCPRLNREDVKDAINECFSRFDGMIQFPSRMVRVEVVQTELGTRLDEAIRKRLDEAIRRNS